MHPTIERGVVKADGLNVHYLIAGEGPAVLLLHGWPTSSYLWREVMPSIAARGRRVIALDLPGFGRSDKPMSASYSFRFYERTLTAFLDALDIHEVGLVVHDLGGPIGLYWATQNMDRVRELALLNTLVYPTMSWAVVAFVVASRLPGVRSLLASPKGLALALKYGLADQSNALPETIEAVQAPFRDKNARRALLKTGSALHIGGFRTIAKSLPSFKGPVKIIYGAKDRILPNVAKTMRRVARDLPQATTTRLDNCGHFLQEEAGRAIGEELGEFFSSAK